MRIFTARTTALLAAGLCLPLGLAACGSDDGDAADQTTTATATSTTTSSTTDTTTATTSVKAEQTSQAAEETSAPAAPEEDPATPSADAEASAQAQALQEELDRLKTEIPTVTEGKPADDEVKQQLMELERNVNSLDPNLDILQFFCKKDRSAPDTGQVVDYRRQMLTVLQQTGQQIPSPQVDITDLKVDESGKKASGTVHLSINLPGAQPQSTPQGFVLEDGQWKVCTLDG
ncbi:hypothetical protein ACFSSC_11520 [Corynebacterium mendelii]|uniref:Low molecular weight antigen MTB12-like C-terminal domain-containing protein n=1 Tax=Corynebacterium mendelii TaxID=2765362 RepID=A0A939DZC8_9CORY|nr:hypothetical protein [Corynebacterium mendelii]MBN9643620.1 hypothetical protein [Corynebacterium mendelii]